MGFGDKETQPVYKGQVKDGKPNGLGVMIFPLGYGGWKYVGEHKDGKPNGQGTRTFNDGGTYVGEWKDGQMDGQGTETYTSGGKYVGSWKDGYSWNGLHYDENGNITGKVINGKN